jgi:hypothetical protein
MPTPNKPTKEELKAAEEEAMQAADELEGKQSIPEDKTEESEEEPEEDKEEEKSEDVDDSSDEEGEEEGNN